MGPEVLRDATPCVRKPPTMPGNLQVMSNEIAGSTLLSMTAKEAFAAQPGTVTHNIQCYVIDAGALKYLKISM